MFKAQVVVETLSFEEGAEEVKVPFLKIEAPSGSIMEPLTQGVVSSLNEAGAQAQTLWANHRDSVGEKAIAMMVAAAQSPPREPLVSARVIDDDSSVMVVSPEDFGGSDFPEGGTYF